MANNAELNAGSGGVILATDEVGGVHHQYVKAEWGADDTATPVTLTDGLPVQPGTATSWAVTGTFWQETQPVSGTITETNSGAIKTAVESTAGAVDGSYINTNLNLAGTDVSSDGGFADAGTIRIITAIGDPGLSLLATIDASNVLIKTATEATAAAASGSEILIAGGGTQTNDLKVTLDSEPVVLGAGTAGIGMINGLASVVDDNNSSEDTLDSGLAFTGDATDTLNYSHVTVSVFADQVSATDGLSIEWSSDGTNWDNTDVFTIAASTGKVFSFGPVSRWMRIVYTNGGVNQGAFRLETILRVGQMSASSHRISDSISSEDDAELVKAVVTGLAPDTTFKNLLVTNAGEMKISLENVNGTFVPITSNTVKDGSGTEYSPLLDADGHFQTDTLKVGSVIDPNNSTEITLGGGGSFVPANGTDLLGYSTVCVTVFADVDSAASGMTFEFSMDDTNWDDMYAFTLDNSDSDTRRFQFPVTARYFRVNYTNGAGAQGAFRVQTILHTANQLTSIHRLADDMSPDRSAQVVKAALYAQKAGSGDLTLIDATVGGNLKVAVEEFDTSLPAGTDTIGGTISQQSTSIAYDGTTACTIKEFMVIGTTAGNNTLVAAVGAKKIRLLSLSIYGTSATANTTYLVNDDYDFLGSSAATIPVAVDADGDNVGGLVMSSMRRTTDTVNEALVAIQSGTAAIIYMGTYIEVD
jgi:hypothetical protein